MSNPLEAQIVCSTLEGEYRKYAKSGRDSGQLLRGVIYFLRTFYGDKEICNMVTMQRKEDQEDQI